MDIQSVNTYRNIASLPAISQPAGPPANAADFGSALNRALDQLQALQTNADDTAMALAAGEPVELAEVMIAMEKANVGFQLALQVRNKLVEAYQEISRLQV